MVSSRVRSVEPAVAAGKIIGFYIALAHRSAVDAYGKMRIHTLRQAFFAESGQSIMPQVDLRDRRFAEHLVDILSAEAAGIGRYFDKLLLCAVIAATVPEDGEKRGCAT